MSVKEQDMRPAIMPTDAEILNEMLGYHPLKRIATLHRLGRRCEMKHDDGTIIDAYEYLGAYFDTEGTRLGSAWVEYVPLKFVKSPVFIAVVSVLFFLIVARPAIADLIEWLL